MTKLDKVSYERKQMCRYSDTKAAFLIKISCLMGGVIVVPSSAYPTKIIPSDFSFFSGLAALIILYHYFRLMYARTPIFTASASFLDKCTSYIRSYPKTKTIIICNVNLLQNYIEIFRKKFVKLKGDLHCVARV